MLYVQTGNTEWRCVDADADDASQKQQNFDLTSTRHLILTTTDRSPAATTVCLKTSSYGVCRPHAAYRAHQEISRQYGLLRPQSQAMLDPGSLGKEK